MFGVQASLQTNVDFRININQILNHYPNCQEYKTIVMEEANWKHNILLADA